MTVPSPNEIPSERFVEQMGNHFLMERLGSDHTFFHIPTQPMEQTLGYDASLQGFKNVVIQYKRLHPNVAPLTGRIDIDSAQLAVLQLKYPPSHVPYAFLGLCRHKTYSTVSPIFSTGQGRKLAAEIIFIDIHSPTVNFRPHPGSLNTKLIVPVIGTEAFRLPKLALEIKKCNVGTFEHESLALREQHSDSGREATTGSVSLLFTKQPGWGT